jgi:O-antigen/teichoic acid export membrane protein
LKLGFAIVGYAALWALLGWVYHDTGAADVGGILGLMVATTAVSGSAAVHFQARLGMARYAWTSITGGISALVLVLALIARGAATLGWLAGALVVGEAVTAGLGMAVLTRERVTMTFSGPTARTILTSSWPLALAQVFVVAYFRVDMMILARFVDIGQVGLYGVVVRIAEPIGLVPAAIAASTYAALSPLWGGREAAAARLYRLVVVVVTSYGIGAAALLAGLAPPLLAWLVPRYAAAGPALQILAWALVFMSANMVTTAALNSLGRQRLLAQIAAATLVFAVIANVVLIPGLGIRGASLATVFTEAWNCALQTIALLRLVRRQATAPVL